MIEFHQIKHKSDQECTVSQEPNIGLIGHQHLAAPCHAIAGKRRKSMRLDHPSILYSPAEQRAKDSKRDIIKLPQPGSWLAGFCMRMGQPHALHYAIHNAINPTNKTNYYSFAFSSPKNPTPTKTHIHCSIFYPIHLLSSRSQKNYSM